MIVPKPVFFEDPHRMICLANHARRKCRDVLNLRNIKIAKAGGELTAGRLFAKPENAEVGGA